MLMLTSVSKKLEKETILSFHTVDRESGRRMQDEGDRLYIIGSFFQIFCFQKVCYNTKFG